MLAIVPKAPSVSIPTTSDFWHQHFPRIAGLGWVGRVGLLLLVMVAAVSGDTGLGPRHVTLAEVKELDEGVGQEEKDTATTQAAERWGRILDFLGGGAGGVLVSQDSSLYLNHNQEADGE